MSTKNENNTAKMPTPINTLSHDYLSKLGIELPKAKDAKVAVKRLTDALPNGVGYVDKSANVTVLQLMDYARNQSLAGETATKRVCLALAAIDSTQAYKTAHDAKGNAYTSMLSMSMDMLPMLSKSTVASYIAVGRNVYIPAQLGEFGDYSDKIAALPPSTLDALKANLSSMERDTKDTTLAILKLAVSQGTVTQRLAKAIARTVKDAVSNQTVNAVSTMGLLKAAKGDTDALKQVYPDKPDAQTRGALQNGGNNAAKNEHNSPEFDAVKARLTGYIAPERDENGNNLKIAVTDEKGLSGFLKRAMVSKEPNDARMAIRALIEIIK